MKINELITQISKKEFNRIYIFTGDDWKLIQLYVDKICSVAKTERKYCNTIYDVINSLNGVSLFTANNCFVLRDDKDMQDESKFNKIKTMLGNNILILIYTRIDKRNRFYKQNNANIVEFEKLDTNTLLNYCSKQIDLNVANMRHLIEICENDLGRILLEIDKIKHYGGNSDETFELLLSKNLIYEPPTDAVFDLVDAILKYDSKRAYEMLQNCKEIGEANLVILTNIFNNAKQVLQVQSYKGSDAEQETGLSSWQIRKARERGGVYSNRELINIMKVVQKIEEGIKTGKIEDEMSVEYLMEEIFRV